MTIKSKLIFVAILTAISLILMLGLQRYALTTVTGLDQLIFKVNKIETDQLSLRKDEKDFIARENLKYADSFKTGMEEMQQDLTALNNAITEQGLDQKKSSSISAELLLYSNIFSDLVKAQQEIGLTPEAGILGEMRSSVHAMEEVLKRDNNYLLLTDMLLLRRHEKDFIKRLDLKYLDNFNNGIAAMQKHLGDSALPAADKAAVKNGIELYNTKFQQLVGNYKKMGLSPDDGLQGEMRDHIHQADTLRTGMKEEINQKIESRRSTLNTISLLLSLMLAGITLGLIFLITKTIDQHLKNFSRVISAASRNRDLSLRADDSGKDEIAEIARMFNGMMGEFQRLMDSAMASSNQLGNSASTLSEAMDKTCKNVNHQRSEIDQVAVAMGQMAGAVQEVARHACDAAEVSQQADGEASRGSHVITQAITSIQSLAEELKQTSTAIGELEQESGNISTVLNVIREIAEQTNLLALNAAIEAARAGEQGRGFAVVADEVRTLAQRSHESTQEINEIITRLQAKAAAAAQSMNRGYEHTRGSVELANAAGLALAEITKAISTINEMNMQIASASEEQSAVTLEINRNVTDITQISDSTVTAVEETFRTGASMIELSSNLQEQIKQFKLH